MDLLWHAYWKGRGLVLSAVAVMNDWKVEVVPDSPLQLLHVLAHPLHSLIRAGHSHLQLSLLDGELPTDPRLFGQLCLQVVHAGRGLPQQNLGGLHLLQLVDQFRHGAGGMSSALEGGMLSPVGWRGPAAA